MKTIIKLIALACAAFFVVAACSAPDAELTERNFKDENKAAYDQSANSGSTNADKLPSFSTNLGGGSHLEYIYVGTGQYQNRHDSTEGYVFIERTGASNYGTGYIVSISNPSSGYLNYTLIGLSDEANDSDVWYWDSTSFYNDLNYNDMYGNLVVDDDTQGYWSEDPDLTSNGGIKSTLGFKKWEKDANFDNDGWYHIDSSGISYENDNDINYISWFQWTHVVPATVDSKSEYYKEVHIDFPDGKADVLNSGDIGAELKKFITFYTFTNPGASENDKASILGAKYDYDYISRNGNTVIVMLKSLPDKNLVVEVDGNNYLIGGYPVVLTAYEKGDYNKYYEQINISKNDVLAADDTFYPFGDQGLGLSIPSLPSGDFFTTDNEASKKKTVRITFGWSGGSISDTAKQAALDAIASKFEIQQFYNGAWTTLVVCNS